MLDNDLALLLGATLAPIFFVFIGVYWTKLNRKAKKISPKEPLPKTQISAQIPEISWQERLQKGLRRTHEQIFLPLQNLFTSSSTKLKHEQLFETLFKALIQADVGVNTSEKLIANIKQKITSTQEISQEQLLLLLKTEILALFQIETYKEQDQILKPQVIMMVGVNGVGKTTTAGKLAFKATKSGLKVTLGAADTFRAAAVEQLKIWAQRANADFVQLKEGADPASVAFEALKVAKAENSDLCIIDTAGRLHNRNDLMQELAKIKKVIAKELAAAPDQVLLVLDATTGQNALQQAKIFKNIVDINGLVITKLDGTAKGGMAIAVVNELKIPIKYIGVGETVEDLEVFKAQDFVDALF